MLSSAVEASPSLKVFKTDRTLQGGFGGLGAADRHCQQEAEAAGLSGTFLAWLSTSTRDAKDRLSHPFDIPYVLADAQETVVATNFADLIDGNIKNGIVKNALGEEINTAPLRAWTGTRQKGVLVEDRNCNNWQTSFSLNSPLGASGDIGRFRWSRKSDESCIHRRRLYCFQKLPDPVQVDSVVDFVDAMSDPSVVEVHIQSGSRFFLSETIDLSGQTKKVSCIGGQDCVVDGTTLDANKSGIFTDGTSATSLEFINLTFENFVSQVRIHFAHFECEPLISFPLTF